MSLGSKPAQEFNWSHGPYGQLRTTEPRTILPSLGPSNKKTGSVHITLFNTCLRRYMELVLPRISDKGFHTKGIVFIHIHVCAGMDQETSLFRRWVQYPSMESTHPEIIQVLQTSLYNRDNIWWWELQAWPFRISSPPPPRRTRRYHHHLPSRPFSHV